MSRTKPKGGSQDEHRAEQAWDPEENAALARLLDHIVKQLAREYVCLMEAAAEEDKHDDRRAEE